MRESMVTSILTSPFGLLIPPGPAVRSLPRRGASRYPFSDSTHTGWTAHSLLLHAALSTAHTVRADVSWTAPITSRRLICAGGRASLKPPAAPLTDLRMPFFASAWSIFARKVPGASTASAISAAPTVRSGSFRQEEHAPHGVIRLFRYQHKRNPALRVFTSNRTFIVLF